MFDHLRGRLTRLSATEAVLEVGGVGYLLTIPLSTFDVLHVGDEVTLLTWLQVREDILRLFGFSTDDERRFFLLLQKVSGVGPSLAVNILSRAPLDELLEMIVEGRVDLLKKLKGIGPKTAERLVTELRTDAGKMGVRSRMAATSTLSGREADAVQALEVLGYPEKPARDAVTNAAAENATATVQDLIRAALKVL